MAPPPRWALTGIPANASPVDETTLPARSNWPSAATAPRGDAKAPAAAMAMAVNALAMVRLAFMFATSSDELGKSHMCGAHRLRGEGEVPPTTCDCPAPMDGAGRICDCRCFQNDTPSRAGFKKSRPQNPTFPLTLEPGAGMRVAMNYSHRARRISVRTRRLSAGAWDMRIG